MLTVRCLDKAFVCYAVSNELHYVPQIFVPFDNEDRELRASLTDRHSAHAM